MDRALSGLVVNISVSESDDSTTQGFPPAQVNRAILQIVSALCGQGVSVLFGHDWREDGVMEAVYGFARRSKSLPSGSDASDGPQLINLIPWPDDPSLAGNDIQALEPTLRVSSAGLPEDLRRIDGEARVSEPTSLLYRYARARGLTHLRHLLSSASDARICVGGRRFGSAGRYPGVVEEALFSIESGKPLLISSVFGGASRQLIDAIEGRSMPSDFCIPTEINSIYRDPPIREQLDKANDRTIDRELVWERFVSLGSTGLSKMTLLDQNEIGELMHTRSIDRLIDLALRSMARLKAERI